jgi:hypothetical protein
MLLTKPECGYTQVRRQSTVLPSLTRALASASRSVNVLVKLSTQAINCLAFPDEGYGLPLTTSFTGYLLLYLLLYLDEGSCTRFRKVLLILLYICPHTTIYVSSYYYICVLPSTVLPALMRAPPNSRARSLCRPVARSSSRTLSVSLCGSLPINCLAFPGLLKLFTSYQSIGA